MDTIIEKKVSELTAKELEQLLNQKKQEEQKIAKKKRETYEATKEATIDELGDFALIVRNMMLDLKHEAFRKLTLFRQQMLEYGDIKGGEKNKGSFQLKNDTYKIEFSSKINKCFDERAELAETKLKEFLASFVKKKDKSAYDLVLALLERNDKTGDFDINLINRLYKMEDRFDNPLWKEALLMFKESYSPYGTAQYIKFSVKNAESNTWEPLVLDFAKIKGTTIPND